jgi:hypothetical protein
VSILELVPLEVFLIRLPSGSSRRRRNLQLLRLRFALSFSLSSALWAEEREKGFWANLR